jgi:hypothetical protein
LPLLHHFVDRERLAEQSLALGGLDCRTTDLRVANHDDRETLCLASLGVGHENRVFDGHEGREEFADLLDLDSRIEVTHVDLEHRHGRYSRWLHTSDQPLDGLSAVRRARKPGKQIDSLKLRPLELRNLQLPADSRD